MLIEIAAIGKNNELGYENKLIWHLPSDMKFFRSTTLGHTVIMGRRTFESLNGLLPNRTHVVISRNPDFKPQGVIVLQSVREVADRFAYSDEECYVMGGGEIYSQLLPYSKKMYLTEIDAEFKAADTFFPKFDAEKFNDTVIGEYSEKETDYKIHLYERKGELNNG